MDRAVQIVVSGRCHGVGFRDFVSCFANLFHLVGTVENTPDTVTIFAKGGEDDIAIFLNAIQYGPSASHVTELKVTDPPADYTFGKVFQTIYPKVEITKEMKSWYHTPRWKPSHEGACLFCMICLEEIKDEGFTLVHFDEEDYYVCKKCRPEYDKLFGEKGGR